MNAKKAEVKNEPFSLVDSARAIQQACREACGQLRKCAEQLKPDTTNAHPDNSVKSTRR